MSLLFQLTKLTSYIDAMQPQFPLQIKFLLNSSAKNLAL